MKDQKKRKSGVYTLRWILILLLCNLVSHVANSQRLADLRPGGDNWGGRVASVCVNPTNANEIWIASEGGGLYQSMDGGYTWSHNTTFPGVGSNCVRMAPNNPDIIIATCGYDSKSDRHIGVWRSVDHGATWKKPDNRLYPQSTECPNKCGASGIEWVKNSNIVYVATDCGLLKSTNNGEVWEEVVVNEGPGGNDARDNWRARPNRVFSIHAINENNIIVGGESGVFYTSDGISWNRSIDGVPSFYCMHSFSSVPQNENFVFRADYNSRWLQYSINAGKSWQYLAPVSADLFFRNSTNQYAFDNAGNPVTRLNGNSPWLPFAGTLLATGNMPAFTRITNSDRGNGYFELYFCNGTKLFKTTLSLDPGTWNSASFKMLKLHHDDPSELCFHPVTKRPWILVGDGGISKTNDDGQSWVGVGTRLNGYNALQVTGLEVQNVTENNGKHDVNFVTWHNGSWASGDNGRTWTDKWPVEGTFITGNSIGSIRASDARNSIRPWNNNPEERGRFLDTYPGNFTPPRNKDWDRTISYFKDPLDGVVYTLVMTRGPGQIFYDKRRPGARSWTQILSDGRINPMSNPVFATSGTQVDAFFVDGSNRLVKVTNINGSSPWLGFINSRELGRIGISSGITGKPLLAVKPDNPQIMIASDIQNGLIQRSINGGVTWDSMITLNNLITDYGRLQYTIVPYHFNPNFSVDQGTHQVFEIAYNPYDPNMVLVGTYENGVFISNDAGLTWNPLEGTQKIPRITEIEFGNANTIYISSWGRGVWVYDTRFFIRRPVDYFPACKNCIVDPTTGTFLPINIITDPNICPVCRHIYLRKGEIIKYNFDKKNNKFTIYATQPEAVYFSGDEESTIEFEVLKGEAMPKITKQKHKCFLQKQQKSTESKNAIMGLVVNDGVVTAEIQNKDNQWQLSDQFFVEAMKGLPETNKPIIRTSIPLQKYDIYAVENSKANLTLSNENNGVIKQGDLIELKGSGFPTSSNNLGPITFYANEIRLDASAKPDEKGELSLSLSLPFPPGPVNIVALFETPEGLRKVQLRINIQNHDENEIQEIKK